MWHYPWGPSSRRESCIHNLCNYKCDSSLYNLPSLYTALRYSSGRSSTVMSCNGFLSRISKSAIAPGAIIPRRPSCLSILAGFIVACLKSVGASRIAERTVNSSTSSATCRDRQPTSLQSLHGNEQVGSITYRHTGFVCDL
jgi:hypothetical protein